MSPSEIASAMRKQGYVAGTELATTLHLARELERPLLVEGEAGVGKTELATCAAAVFDARLIRLQCYEGLDAPHALYDWDYRRQLLAIQIARESERATLEADTLYD